MQPSKPLNRGCRSIEISPIHSCLKEIYSKYRDDFRGAVASYIPELAKADPSLFAIVLVTADGQVYQVGDTEHQFTIQSISKPFVYGLALEDHGLDHVLGKVGVEPTGEAFNSIVFDERRNRPFNPMVNAGAIATTALIQGRGHDQRLTRLLGKFSDLAGRPLEIDHGVYISERTTGHRNRAIGYLELNSGMIDEPVNDHLDLYFEQCSILVNARDLAVMAATLANGGVNPLTRRRALDERYVKNVLSVMHSCGMYDYAGEWSYRIGLPAKSGVGGGIIAVLPGQFGVGTFSAPLDDQGNSWRGIRVCEELSGRFKLHMFKSRSNEAAVVRRSYRGDAVRSKRRRNYAEEEILHRHGAATCVLELQGSLFFGTVERALRQISEDIDGIRYLILDLKRVLAIDECAAMLLEQMRQVLEERQKKLLLTHCQENRDEAFEMLLTDAFSDIDAALEWCEEQWLREGSPHASADGTVALPDMNILQGLGPQDITLIETVLVEKRYASGERIINEGESADAIYLLASGRVSIYLSLKRAGRRQRLSTISPGVAFGELALLDGGARSADAVADEPSLCYVLPIDKLQALARCHPNLESKLIANIGRELSARLRRADAEIRALAD